MSMSSISATSTYQGVSTVSSMTVANRLVRRMEAETTSAATAANGTDRVSVPQTSGLMANHDLRNISFADMAQLGKDLVAAGILPEDKMLDFIPLPTGFKVGSDGSLSFRPDVPIDMIQRQQDIIASQKTSGMERRFIDYSTSVLNMYQNIQALHEQAST